MAGTAPSAAASPATGVWCRRRLHLALLEFHPAGDALAIPENAVTLRRACPARTGIRQTGVRDRRRHDGRWLTGHVDGILVDAGWGASLGYPALVLDSAGSAIAVDVFESIDLPAHWARLDAFEGPGYQRVVTTVRTSTGDVDASIYVLV